MTIFALVLISLLVIVALERSNRRQSARPSGLSGSSNHEDRDWARTKLDLLALGGRAEPFAHKPMALKRPGATSAQDSQQPRESDPWSRDTSHHSGPRTA